VPRAIFLDTQVFLSENFAYESPRLLSLRRLSCSGDIEVLLVDITAEETRKKIREQIPEVEEGLSLAKKKARVLRNLDRAKTSIIFDELDTCALEAELIQQFDAFLEEAVSEVVGVDLAKPSTVFDKYFAGAAPFTGSKKAEFPDSFMLEAIDQWCELADRPAYVVSADKGIVAACEESERLTCVKSLSRLLKGILEEVEKEFVERIRGELESREDELVAAVARELVGDYTWVDAEEGEATITDIAGVQLLSLFVVSKDAEQAVVDADARILVQADASYLNPDTAFLDNEDRWIHWERIHSSLEEELDVPVQFTLSLSRTKGEPFEIRRVLVNDGDSLVLSLW
jgi:hypothetical protein